MPSPTAQRENNKTAAKPIAQGCARMRPNENKMSDGGRERAWLVS
jgi:hypothetical protein